MTLADLNRRHFALSAMAAALLGASRTSVSACPLALSANAAAQAIVSRWSGDLHPLIGRVWSKARPWSSQERAFTNPCGSFSELADFLLQLARPTYVLVGEIHDNNEHHVVRAHALQVAQWRSTNDPTSPNFQRGVVFEHVRADQREALNRFAAMKPAATVDDLLRALDWEHSGWSKMANFKPLLEAAVANELAIYPGDPSRNVIRKVAKEGLAAALTQEEIAFLALDTPLGDAAAAALRAEIEASHCGMIPKSAMHSMAQAQNFRDAHMADALISAAKAHGSAILFSGNGHVRIDRGVPWYLRWRKPHADVIAVMLLEVEGDQADPEAYIPRAPDGQPVADFILFTPKAKRDSDPCESIKRKP